MKRKSEINNKIFPITIILLWLFYFVLFHDRVGGGGVILLRKTRQSLGNENYGDCPYFDASVCSAPALHPPVKQT
jgi:hypothetical protein